MLMPTLVLIIFLICIYFLINLLTVKINKEKSDIELFVGKKVILQKDTLLITDYSMFSETYKLSNGAEISFKLAKELKKVP